MGQSGVLICDTQRRFLEALASGFRELGWDVHATYDDAEAGHRLLMWFDPHELPRIAVLNLDDADELLDFCLLLNEQAILTRVQVIVFLDESADTAADFRQIGIIPLPTSTDPWPQVKAVVDRLEEGHNSGDPTALLAMQELRAHQHANLNHQHSEQSSLTAGLDSIASWRKPVQSGG